jgi:hypothetical protein
MLSPRSLGWRSISSLANRRVDNIKKGFFAIKQLRMTAFVEINVDSN